MSIWCDGMTEVREGMYGCCDEMSEVRDGICGCYDGLRGLHDGMIKALDEICSSGTPHGMKE